MSLRSQNCNLSTIFKNLHKWTKSVHDFSEMDKKCPLNFHPKLKTRKFENLIIGRFPTQKKNQKVEKSDRQELVLM